MRFVDFISVRLTFFLIVGILIGYWFDISLGFSFSLLLGSLAVLAYAFLRQKRNSFPLFGFVALIATSALGIFITALAKDASFDSHFSHHVHNEQQVWQLKVSEVLKSTDYSDRYFAQVQVIDNNPAIGKVLLSIQKDSLLKTLRVDNEILLISEATEIRPPLNPHQFDYRAYLKKKGITYQLRVKPNEILPTQVQSKTLIGSAANFREHIISKLKQADFGEQELAVIQALLLGQRNDISETTYDDYKNAGAVHILAVSGLHVGILLLILQFLLQPLERLPKGRTLKLVLILLLLWAFAFIAGLSPSIVRAITMFSFIAYAMQLNRPVNTFNIIALSMLFILLFKPMFLFEIGFQMSYAAVFAIVWIYPKLQRFWYPSNWLVRQLWQLFSVSIAAQLGVLPISLFYFHQFPALFFVSNLVVVPFLGIILGMGILVIAMSLLNSLPQFLVSAYDFLIKSMNSIIGWVAQQEAFVFRNIPFDQVQLVLTYLLIFGLVFTLSKPKFKNIALLLGTFAMFTGWSVYQQYQLKGRQQLILAHQTKNTVLLHQNGEKLIVNSHNRELIDRIAIDFTVAEWITKLVKDTLRNSYTLNNKQIYVMDSLGIYPRKKHPDYLLLTQSPKINLERLIDSIHPKHILVDGSNYTSYVQRWKTTCLKKKIPFHHTGEKGAYYFDLKD